MAVWKSCHNKKEKTTMDLVELRELIEEFLEDSMPNFEIGLSANGEIIIATGLQEDDDGNLIEMDEDVDDESDPDLEPLEEDLPEDEEE
jgi:hypothetical protein